MSSFLQLNIQTSFSTTPSPFAKMYYQLPKLSASWVEKIAVLGVVDWPPCLRLVLMSAGTTPILQQPSQVPTYSGLNKSGYRATHQLACKWFGFEYEVLPQATRPAVWAIGPEIWAIRPAINGFRDQKYVLRDYSINMGYKTTNMGHKGSNI